MATEQRDPSSLFRAHVPYYTACHGTNNRNEFDFLLHGSLANVFGILEDPTEQVQAIPGRFSPAKMDHKPSYPTMQNLTS